MADHEEVASLFNIVAQAQAHGDMFKNIRNMALEKLKAIDAEHAKPAPTVPYTPTALDKAIVGTDAGEPPPTAEPTDDEMRRL